MQITNFNPTSGPVDTPVTLELTGVPLDADDTNTIVTLSGSQTVQVDSIDAMGGTINVTIGANSQSGEFAVLVASRIGPVGAQSAEIFTVTVPEGEPQITNMTPRSAVAGQSQITLSGRNLDEIQYVIVGNTAVMNLQRSGTSQIRFMLPGNVQAGQYRVVGQSPQFGRVNSPFMLTVATEGLTGGPPPSLVTPQVVADAWADLRSWVEGTLPVEAQLEPLPGQQQDAGDIGACNALNIPTNPPNPAIWGSDGDATIVLTSMKITAMAGVQAQPAVQGDGGTMQLPLSFSQLEVTGSYNYGQPCACYDLGKKVSTTTANGSGTLTQTITNSTLYYVVNLGSTLTLGGVVVNGSPTVNVSPDNGGLPDWLTKLADFFSAFHEAEALRGSLQNLFLTADFSQTMLALLKQKIGG